jgi:chromosome segregation ATPase
MRQELVGSAAALDAAQSRVTELDQALAISVAAASTLQEQVRLAHQGEHQLQRALETARHDFASELDKLRADGKLAQERLKAAETRALLEIDRERGNAAKAQKELTESVKRFDKRDADHRRAQDGLQAQLGDARQQIGMLQGKLGTLEAAYAALREELAHERHIQRTASTASRRTEPSSAGAPRRAARKMPASKTARAKPRT